MVSASAGIAALISADSTEWSEGMIELTR
jgi:hypothetical protein